jgi:hypothetical protein
MKISEDALNAALVHIELRGDTDIFPMPFEYKAIRHQWDSVREYLTKQELSSWSTRPYRRCLVPKGEFGLRVATQLDPLDCLLFTAQVIECGEDIESARVPVTQKVVHSHRFKLGENGQIYDPKYNFDSFRKDSLRRASAKSCKLVVLTDISDFYTRIYMHPLENALRNVTDEGHAHAIEHMIYEWNMSVSYGIPVGPSASRILADLTIEDIDQGLKSEGFKFCRYSDDYRVFAKSEREARAALAFLADGLFKSHGLTLQEGKTEILSSDEFIRKFSFSEEDLERESLDFKLSDLLSDVGNPYEEIDFDDLDEEVQEAIRELNLWEILKEEVNGADTKLNFRLAVFVLRQIAQLGLTEPEPILLPNVRKLYPVLSYVISAIESQASLADKERKKLGAALMKLLDHELIGSLDYHREWILKPFEDSAAWNQKDELIQLYGDATDTFTRRRVILALGRQKAFHWFKQRKSSVFDLPPWERRAFIYGAACLPGDEPAHWYKFIKPRLDPLEAAIAKFAVATHS